VPFEGGEEEGALDAGVAAVALDDAEDYERKEAGVRH